MIKTPPAPAEKRESEIFFVSWQQEIFLLRLRPIHQHRKTQEHNAKSCRENPKSSEENPQTCKENPQSRGAES